MKIKIKSTKEYSVQYYLIRIIGILIIPVVIFCITKFIAPNLSLCIFLNTFLSVAGFAVALWFLALIYCLYKYLVVLRLPEEKEFDEIIFQQQGISLKKIINKQITFINYNYEDIECLNLEIKTTLTYTSNGRAILSIERIDLIFTMTDEQLIKINLWGNINYIYKILDFHKKFKNFDYLINGPIGGLEEKIEFYKLKGAKIIFPNETIPTLYLFVFLMMGITIWQLVSQTDIIISFWPMAIFPLMTLLTSICLFTLIQIDKKIKRK